MIAREDYELNKNMAYLIESLKVDGYWSSKNFSLSIQNKDIPFLNYIEKIVKNLDINISKRLLLKIKLEDNTKKDDIKLMWKDKELNFHIEKSPFNENKVKAVTSLPYKKEYEINLIHKNKKIPIKIKSLKEKIIYESETNCWIYKDLRFPTRKLLTFLDGHCKRNKNLNVEKALLNSNKNIVMSAFSALVDCEGTINWYGFKREIQIRMKERIYLLQWKKLLEKLKIGCRVQKEQKELWGLIISGWEDFDKLEKFGFKLHHSKKANKWKDMMKNFKRNQISRNSYKEFYTKKIKEINKKITAKEFAKYLNKSKRVVNHYLSRLEKEKLITCDKECWPYLYFIST